MIDPDGGVFNSSTISLDSLLNHRLRLFTDALSNSAIVPGLPKICKKFESRVYIVL